MERVEATINSAGWREPRLWLVVKEAGENFCVHQHNMLITFSKVSYIHFLSSCSSFLLTSFENNGDMILVNVSTGDYDCKLIFFYL